MSKAPLGFHIHLIRSPPSIGEVLAPSIRRECSSSSISQSLKSLIKRTSQILLPLPSALAKKLLHESPYQWQYHTTLGMPIVKVDPHTTHPAKTSLYSATQQQTDNFSCDIHETNKAKVQWQSISSSTRIPCLETKLESNEHI